MKTALESASLDDSIKITLVTGTGDYFTSGNDFGKIDVSTDIDTSIRRGVDYVR